MSFSLLNKNFSTVKSGTIWALLGFGSEMFFRMVSSLVLTRIFLPDVFGVIAIVSAVLVGMEMLSDVGVRTSLIHNKDAKKLEFAQTAWTVQILRGFLLWFIVLLSSDTLAEYFREPLLSELLPIGGLVLVFKGFVSPNLHFYSRELGVAKIILMKILVQLIAITFVIVTSLIYKSIWAIIFGTLLSAILTSVLSFTLFSPFTIGFRLEIEALKAIFRLGKWLFFATVFHFLISQGDRLILGGLIDKAELGLYNLAAMFVQIPISILSALTGQILMPFLSKSHRDKPEDFDRVFNELLDKILKYMLPLVFVLVVFGDLIIQFLYPEDFYLAGDILQILAVASFFQILSFSLIPVFLSRGDSFRHMLAYLCLLCLYLPGIYLGHKHNAIWGAFYGMFAAQVLWVPLVILLANKYVQLNVYGIFRKLFVFLGISVSIVFLLIK